MEGTRTILLREKLDEGVDKQEDPTCVTGNEEPLPTATDSVGEGGYEECRIPASDAMCEEL
jgi:hypothetical protein